MKRPLILISNDDGYMSKGIDALIEMTREFGEIIVVAPDSSRSGASMSITSTIPVKNRLIRQEKGLTVWSCSGTPDDCIKMAFEVLCPSRPDLVLGGINHGNNCAVNAHYSGTVSIAMEACLKGVPSVAFSLDDMSKDADFTPMAPYVKQIVRMALEGNIPKWTCLNVNAPANIPIKGMTVKKMDMGEWHDEWQEREHPHGGKYYWISGYYASFDPNDESSDTWAMKNGYVTITPLRLDLTSYSAMETIKKALDL